MTQLRSLKLITYKGGSLGDPESHGGAARRPHPTCRSVSPHCQEALRRRVILGGRSQGGVGTGPLLVLARRDLYWLECAFIPNA